MSGEDSIRLGDFGELKGTMTERSGGRYKNGSNLDADYVRLLDAAIFRECNHDYIQGYVDCILLYHMRLLRENEGLKWAEKKYKIKSKLLFFSQC